MCVEIDNGEVLVSVICLVYNHEKYIRDALEGFVMQKTNFKYEVLIHDDASTDNSASIIREYEKKYPDIIKPIYQKENQYSQGCSISLSVLLPKAQGKYIAVCEGDDYWIDDNKLQIQAERMMSDSSLSLCCHAVWNERNGEYVSKIMPYECDTIVSIQEMIRRGGGFFGTCSYFLRKDVYDNIPEFMRYASYDFSLTLNAATKGRVLYINKAMGVYRQFTENSFTSIMKNDKTKALPLMEREIHMLELFDKNTNQAYKDDVEWMISRVKINIAKHTNKYTDYKKAGIIFDSCSNKEKIGIFLQCNLPLLYKFVIYIHKKVKKIG